MFYVLTHVDLVDCILFYDVFFFTKHSQEVSHEYINRYYTFSKLADYIVYVYIYIAESLHTIIFT